jgi:hypothetical protein
MKLGKYSIGIGDRFAMQGKAQLAAVIKAGEKGVEVTPVWNKSYREHLTIQSKPISTRREADKAVKSLGFKGDYFVDADHVNRSNVDFFMESSDFFTLDVADFIGKSTNEKDIQEFVDEHKKYIGEFRISSLKDPFEITIEYIEKTARKFLFAVQEAGRIYRHILVRKGRDPFIVEISLDETEKAQSPMEMLFILSAISREKIPVQTIAPKFTGQFNKGVDYVGDVSRFILEFEQDILLLHWAVKELSLPEDLKLSVHSGSDKFSLYDLIREVLIRNDAGLHLKTAGTTWLEEVTGLAKAGGDGLDLVKELYWKACSRYEELCEPYAAVIHIEKDKLPLPEEVLKWDESVFVNTLKHVPVNKQFNGQFRQMFHISYKIAAEIGDRYLLALEKHKKTIAQNVTDNIYNQHIKPLFIRE